MKKPEYHTLRAQYVLDPFVQGDDYSYTISQVRTIPEGQTSLTSSEVKLLAYLEMEYQ